MIAFVCSGCKKNLKVKDDFAGRTTNCPACKARLVVPSPVAPPAPAPFDFAAAPQAAKWSPGDRVLAHWPKEVSWWYSGTVVETEGEGINVRFDDGNESWLSADQVTGIDLVPGSRVAGRWKNGSLYYPGIVTEAKGEDVRIRYDDGDEEWTHVRSIRVDRGQPSSAAKSGRSVSNTGSNKPAIYVVLGISAAAVVILLLGVCGLAVFLSNGGQTSVARKSNMTTAEFEGLVIDKRGHEVLEAVGRPASTQKIGDNEFWYYEKVAIDPISSKRASAQLVFPGDSTGWCQIVNWH
jgi:DNA-directed RNA polymerase subunit RPC12/RpoP